jgi:hypothetical protein
MKIQRLREIVGALGLTMVLLWCSTATAQTPADGKTKPAPPPEPVVNHPPSDAQPGQRIEHGELILDVDEETRQQTGRELGHMAREARKLPGPVTRPAMKDVKDFAVSKSVLDVINPAPGEYIHVMEGQRHGYENLSIGITYTKPGGAPPMQIRKSEGSCVLLKRQKVMYAMGEKLFVAEGPCIINIPAGVPHAFQNLDDEVAELVMIFPANEWEYVVLDYSPFDTPQAKAMAAEAKRTKPQSQAK